MGRLGYFDMAKGIAILLVIIGHNSIPEDLRQWIYSFHMPLFFIISGYFSKNIEMKEVVKKGWLQLLRPYFFTGLLLLLFFVVFQSFQKLFTTGTYNIEQFQDILVDIFSGHFGALWFLLALFFAKIFFAIALKTGHAFIVTLFFASIGYIFGHLGYYLPGQIFAGMIASLYLFIGYQLKLNGAFDFSLSQSNVLVASVFVYFSALSMYMQFLDYFPNYIFSIVSSSIITFCVIKDCQILETYKNKKIVSIFVKVLIYLGKNSLIILCFHNLEMLCNLWKYVAFIGDDAMLCSKILILSLIPLGIKYIPVVNVIFNKK